MGISDNNDALSKALNMLKRLRRLKGTALISNGVLLHDDVPHGAGDSGAEFSREVGVLFEQYTAEDAETVNQVLLGFDGGNVILFNFYPAILALFFDDLSTIDSVERSGRQFLNQFHSSLGIQSSQPIRTSALTGAANEKPLTAPVSTETEEAEPVIENAPIDAVADPVAEWAVYRQEIEKLFTKVLGSAQANRIIQRELKAMGVSEGSYLRKPQFRPFGLKMTQRIRDKSIRKQLELELFDVLSDD